MSQQQRRAISECPEAYFLGHLCLNLQLDPSLGCWGAGMRSSTEVGRPDSIEESPGCPYLATLAGQGPVSKYETNNIPALAGTAGPGGLHILGLSGLTSVIFI